MRIRNPTGEKVTFGKQNPARSIAGLSTWWPGCLPMYSSIYGFGAAWCFLNAHRPIEFARFISEACGTPVMGALSDAPLHAATPSLRIANSLGERRRFVQSMSPRIMYPPSWRDEGQLANGQWPYIDVQVCPACWDGACFHSIFHMRTAGADCPIHRVGLLKLTVIERKGHPPGGPRDIGLIEALLQHLQAVPPSRNSLFRSRGQELDTKPLDDFCRWIHKQNRDKPDRLCFIDFGASRSSWETIRGRVYASPVKPPATMTNVLSDSPYRGGVVTKSWHINPDQYEKTTAMFEAIGFSRLMAMAWTTQVIKGFTDCPSELSGRRFDPKTSGRWLSPLYRYQMSGSDGLDLLSKACGRILLDSQFGWLSQSGNGLILHTYENTGDILESLGVMKPGTASGQLIRYTRAMKNRKDRSESRKKAGGWELLSETCAFKCYEYLSPWQQLFNYLCALLVSCELSRSTEHAEKDEQAGQSKIYANYDPAVNLSLAKDRLTARVYLRSKPLIAVGPNLVSWYEFFSASSLENILTSRTMRKRWPLSEGGPKVSYAVIQPRAGS